MAVNVVKLGDVATISAGQSAPKSNYFCEEGIPFVRAGSLEFLERGESIDLCEKISEDNAQICRLKLYPKNSILFAKSGMSANKGRIYKLERSAYIVSHLAIITPDETKLIPEYLMYWLQKHPPKTLIKDESYPSIGLTDIANMEIELPPLDYQKKIAKILDKADEIRAKKKLANDKLDEFLKSTYIDLFAENTKKVKLEELCYFITKGTTPKAQDMSQDSGDIPYIKVYNLRFDTRLLSYFVYGMYITIFQGKTLEDVVFLKYITSAKATDFNMPKLPEKSSDEILNEWKEAYKTEPNKYKEKLAGVVYSSWYYMVPKSEECQKYPLTCLCDFDVNRVIDEMVYGKKFPKEKIRFNFFATLMNEAKKYCEEEEYFLSLVLYATYIEHAKSDGTWIR